MSNLHSFSNFSSSQAPFDDKRLVFPPLPAMFVASIFYHCYQMIFPVFMVNIVAAGTMTGMSIAITYRVSKTKGSNVSNCRIRSFIIPEGPIFTYFCNITYNYSKDM